MKHRYKFTKEENDQIALADEDMDMAVIGFILCKNGFKIGDGFEKGCAIDYSEGWVEFGRD